MPYDPITYQWVPDSGAAAVNQRSQNIPPSLAAQAPNAALALMTSRLFNTELGVTSAGVQSYLGRFGTDPIDAITRITSKDASGKALIPPGLQPFAYWLVNASRRSLGFGSGNLAAPISDITLNAMQNVPGHGAMSVGPSMSALLDKAYDPFNLSNLVVRAAPGHVVLRNSVMDMLSLGHGQEARQDTITILKGDLPAHEAAGYRVVSSEGNKVTITRDIAAVEAQPYNSDFQRASLLLATLKTVYPGLFDPKTGAPLPGAVEFESGGLVGQLLHMQTRGFNLLTAPLTYAAREETHLAAKAVGYSGPRFAAPDWGDTVDRALHSASWEAGNDIARSYGLLPSDAAFAPVAALAGWTAGFYLDPYILVGKAAAGLRLANELPIGENAVETAKALQGMPWLKQKAYMATARSVPDIIASPGGQARVAQGWSIVKNAADAPEAAATLKTFWGKYVSAGAAEHLAQATSPGDFGMRMIETFRPPGLDVAATYRNINRMEQELNIADSEMRLGAATDATVQRQIDLVGQIKAERAKLVTPQSAFMGDPTRLLPSAGLLKRTFTKLQQVAESADPEAGVVKRILNSNVSWLADAALSPGSLLSLPGTRLSAERWYAPISGRIVKNFRLGDNEAATEATLRNFEGFLTDRGLLPAERRDLVARMLAAKNPQEWADVFLRDTPEAIANSRMPNWAKADAQTYFNNLQSEEYSLFPNETPILGDPNNLKRTYHSTWWDKDTGAPIPARVGELSDTFILPSHGDVLDASGFWRKRVLGGVGKGSKETGISFRMRLFDGWAMWQRFLNAGTTAWRDAVLLSRPLSVMLRTALEEQFRIPLGADVSIKMRVPALFWNKIGSGSYAWADKFLKGDLQSLGLLGDDLYYSQRAPSAHTAAHWNLNPMSGVGSDEFIGAWSRKQHELVKALTDPLDQQFAAGASEADALRWLHEDPEGQAYREVMSHQIARGPGAPASVGTGLPQVGETVEYKVGFPPNRYRGRVARHQFDPVTKDQVPIVTDVVRLDPSGNPMGAARAGYEEPALDIVKRSAIPAAPSGQLSNFIKQRKATADDAFGGNTQLMRAIAGRGGKIYTSDAAQALGDVQRTFDDAAQLRSDAAALSSPAEQARQLETARWLERDAVNEIRRYARERPEASKGMARMDRLMRKAIANKDVPWIRDNFPGWLESHGAIDMRSKEFLPWLQNRWQAPDGSFPFRGDPNIADPAILEGFEPRVGGTRQRGVAETPTELGPGEAWKSSPEVAGKPFDPWLDVKKTRGWGSRNIRNKMYRKFLSTPDKNLARVPAYRGLAERRLRELLSLGFDRARAEEYAARWAKEQTSDLLYDLGTRTSAQYFFRHLFPFMPAYEEIMKTWMWKLPMNRGGPLLGHAYILTRGAQIAQGFKALGIDLNHPLAVPFLGPILAAAMGGGPDVLKATFNPKSLNLVSSGLGFLPGTGIMASIPIYWGGRAFKQFEPVAKYMEQNFDPTLWPSSLAHLVYAATGQQPPLDYLSKEAEDNYTAMARDKAMRFARVQLAEQGIKMPKLQDFRKGVGLDRSADPDTDYRLAVTKYQDTLVHKAQMDLRTWQLAVGLWATFYPAPVSVTDSYAQDVTKMYDQVLKPLPKGSPIVGDVMKAWLADHPYGDMYLIGVTDAKPGVPIANADDYSQFKAELTDGLRSVRTPEEYAQISMGLISRHLFQDQLQQRLDKIGDAGSILTHWGQYGEAHDQFNASWTRYLAQNQDFAAWWGKKYPHDTDTEAMFSALSSLHQLQSFFTVGGIRSADYRKTLATISAKLSEAVQFKGGSYRQASDVSWWFDNVFRPQSDQVEQMYATINKANLDSDINTREATYTKLRDFYDSQKPVVRNGITYPTIERWSWGAKTPQEQGVESAKWAMGKPEWLTNFQRETVGYPSGPDATLLADRISTLTSQYYARLNTDPHAHGTGSEKFKASLKAGLQTDIKNTAQRLGGDALRLYGVMFNFDGTPTTPAQRLDHTGHWENDSAAQQLLEYAHGIIGQLQANDLSPTGNSAMAVDLKTQFYREAQKAYANDGAFQADIDPIHAAQSPDWTDPRLPWNDLWAELFFGQFPITLGSQTSSTPKGLGKGGNAPSFPSNYYP